MKKINRLNLFKNLLLLPSCKKVEKSLLQNFKLIRNTLPNKSRNSDSHKKWPWRWQSSLTNVLTVRQDLQRASWKLFYLRFCVTSDQWKQTTWQRFCYLFEWHFYMKIIVNFNFYKLSYKLTLITFFSFLMNQKQEPIF